MSTNPLIGSACRYLRPNAPSDSNGDMAAFAANDNRVPRNAPLPYARGVILAMGFDEDEAPVVTLHLLLPDGEIGVPFHAARHDVDVIALWRGLGRDFNLPLYVRGHGGELTAVTSGLGDTSYPRRVGSPLSARRPRFLSRRRMPLVPHDLSPEALAAEIG